MKSPWTDNAPPKGRCAVVEKMRAEMTALLCDVFLSIFFAWFPIYGFVA